MITTISFWDIAQIFGLGMVTGAGLLFALAAFVTRKK